MRFRHTIGISLDNELLRIIDKKRGFVPRSRYVEEIVKKSLEVTK